MSDKSIDKGRRGTIKLMMGGLATVPLMNLVGMAAAQAEGMPKVDEKTDPTATALQYKHEAPDEKKKAGQTCATCQFVQAGEGDWLPCQLFPGKSVKATGWCASWALKAGA